MSQIQRVEQYSKKLREYCEDPIQSEEVLQTVKDIGSELILNISEGNIGISTEPANVISLY